MNKSITFKQLEANRRNAKKWWVKSEKWKQIVSKNAVKHWLTSSIIIDEEEKRAYDEFLQSLSDDNNVCWILENVLKERISLHYIKLQRVAKLDALQMKVSDLGSKIKYLEDIMPDDIGLDLDFMKTDDAREKCEQLRKEIWKIKTEIAEIQKEYINVKDIDIFERFQKYETAIENRLYKTIAEYYKIRAIRSWMPVMNVEINQ